MKGYTSKAVAQWLGLTERRVRQLRDDGVIKEIQPGIYDLHSTVLKYISYLRGVGEVSLQTERMKLTAEKRKAAEMDNKLRSGGLHNGEDIERAIKTVNFNVRSRLLVIPAKLAPKLKETTLSQAEIFDMLKEEIEEALRELAEGRFILSETEGTEDGKEESTD